MPRYVAQVGCRWYKSSRNERDTSSNAAFSDGAVSPGACGTDEAHEDAHKIAASSRKVDRRTWCLYLRIIIEAERSTLGRCEQLTGTFFISARDENLDLSESVDREAVSFAKRFASQLAFNAGCLQKALNLLRLELAARDEYSCFIVHGSLLGLRGFHSISETRQHERRRVREFSQNQFPRALVLSRDRERTRTNVSFAKTSAAPAARPAAPLSRWAVVAPARISSETPIARSGTRGPSGVTNVAGLTTPSKRGDRRRSVAAQAPV